MTPSESSRVLGVLTIVAGVLITASQIFTVHAIPAVFALGVLLGLAGGLVLCDECDREA